MQTDAPQGVTASPSPSNIMLWDAVIFGPEDTPFEDGTFRLQLEFDESYPTKPPKVKFLAKMFHPNGTRIGRPSSCRNFDSNVYYAV